MEIYYSFRIISDLIVFFENMVDLNEPCLHEATFNLHSPRNPRFASSKPTEVYEHKSSGKDVNLEVPSLRFQAR